MIVEMLLCLSFVFASAFLLGAAIAESGFYSLEARTTDGETVRFDRFRGKVVLLVNVASQCGYTDSNYEALQRLQDGLGEDGLFAVLAFPCNQFGGQEPDTNEEIARFATGNYKVTFPLFAKGDVIGPDAQPVWKYLTSESGVSPTWNFHKYLVDHTGEIAKAFPANEPVESTVRMSEKLVKEAGAAKKEL